MTKEDRYDRFLLEAEKIYDQECKKPQPEGACDPGCPGWAVFEVNREPGREVERCDACGRFDLDDDALDHVLKLVYPHPMCGDDECILCRRRYAGICDCGACGDCLGD